MKEWQVIVPLQPGRLPLLVVTEGRSYCQTIIEPSYAYSPSGWDYLGAVAWGMTQELADV